MPRKYRRLGDLSRPIGVIGAKKQFGGVWARLDAFSESYGKFEMLPKLSKDDPIINLKKGEKYFKNSKFSVQNMFKYIRVRRSP